MPLRPARAIVAMGEWLPDSQALGAPGSLYLKNSVPLRGGYASWQALQEASSALSGRARGVIAAVSHGGTPTNFAGDAEALYQLVGNTWTDKSGSTYAVLGDRDVWDFTQYGNQIVAAGWGNNVQILTMDTGGSFGDMSASAPQAKYVATCRSFIVLAFCTDGATPIPNRVQWGPIGNPTGDWTPDIATLAGRTDLRGNGGHIQRIIGGEYVTIFQENSIWRMSFAGPPVKFQFDEVEPGRGTPAPRSVIQYGRMIFYWGQDGVYMFDGTSSVPIGKNKIDEFLLADVDQNYYDRVTAIVNPIKSLVVWSYPGQGNVGGTPNRLLFYNWVENRFGYAEQEMEWIALWRGQGLDMDTLGDIYPNLDEMPIAMDGRDWISGQITLRAFDTNHKSATFTGAHLPATFRMGEQQFNPTKKSIVTQMRPIVEASAAEDAPVMHVRLGTRNMSHSPVVWDVNYVPIDSEGDAFPRQDEGMRYFQVELTIAGQFTHATGIEVYHTPDGER